MGMHGVGTRFAQLSTFSDPLGRERGVDWPFRPVCMLAYTVDLTHLGLRLRRVRNTWDWDDQATGIGLGQ